MRIIAVGFEMCLILTIPISPWLWNIMATLDILRGVQKTLNHSGNTAIDMGMSYGQS